MRKIFEYLTSISGKNKILWKIKLIFYINIANQIGNDDNMPKVLDTDISLYDFVRRCCAYHANHPSINKILAHKPTDFSFDFQKVQPDQTLAVLRNLNTTKAVGYDAIPARFLRDGATILAPHVTTIFNSMVATSTFPSSLKYAEVSPIYKKDDPLVKKNYRPVSILTSLSKVFENLILNQLHVFTNAILNPGMSAFRSGYGCQHVLLNFTEDWRMAIEQRKHTGALLVDLSKAFDCLPFSLTIAKLAAYGCSERTANLMASYLTERKQCVKIASVRSQWRTPEKGVPQGSVLGPVIFNVFMNDLFYSIEKCTLYNYADDNTILAIGNNVENVRDLLKCDAYNILSWCDVNCMEANPSKFQLILANSKQNSDFSVRVQDSVIKAEPHVKLLGVHIDVNLNFSYHVSQVCNRANRQLNALKRLANFLDVNTKLQLYKSFIMCHFSYCPLVWNMCGKTNNDKLERIQYRALKFIFEESVIDYCTLLNKAGLKSLEVNREIRAILEVFKCLHGSNPSYLCNMFSIKSVKYNLRRDCVLTLINSRTNIGLHSFKQLGARLWNSLLNQVKNLRELSELKTASRKIITEPGVNAKSLCHLLIK